MIFFIFGLKTGGKQTVMDITGMMDSYIVGMERERVSAQHIQLVIRLVVVSTMLLRNSFSRKRILSFYLLLYACYFN